jgi:SAM-dependent methyltransferase
VDANHAANGHRANVLIVQGDLYDMPFRPGSFDRLFCFGVLQHTPNVRRSFHSLAKMVRSSGALVVDVYRKPSPLKRLLTTKYWVRPLTRRMPAGALYRITAAYVSFMWPIVRIIDRIPRYGAKIVSQLLVADYRGVFPLPEHLLREWAILDTFDMLSPAYDDPQTLQVVREWFSEAGFTDTEVKYGYNGIEGKGTRLAGV